MHAAVLQSCQHGSLGHDANAHGNSGTAVTHHMDQHCCCGRCRCPASRHPGYAGVLSVTRTISQSRFCRGPVQQQHGKETPKPVSVEVTMVMGTTPTRECQDAPQGSTYASQPRSCTTYTSLLTWWGPAAEAFARRRCPG